jgi:uncharacterized protein DUF433
LNKCPAKSVAWLFKGTRVPVRALFENLENGARIEDFLQWFPGVIREQAVAVLRHAGFLNEGIVSDEILRIEIPEFMRLRKKD